MYLNCKPAQSQRRFSQTPITPKSTRNPKPPHTSLDTTPYSGKRFVPPESELETIQKWYFAEKVVVAIMVPCTALFAYKYFNESEIDMKGAAASPGAVKRMIQYNKTFVFSMRNVEEGRWWTGITSTFAHAGVLHLIVNMGTLWSLGPIVAKALGPKRFSLIYFGAGIVGSLAQYYWWKRSSPEDKDAGAVGASGSLLGLVGALAIAMPRLKVMVLIFPMALWQCSAGILGLSIASLYNGWLPGLGHAAHLGGMLFGGLSWIMMRGVMIRGVIIRIFR
jgi:membrane associated rhomboid family serine protease